MATSGITKNFVISGKEQVERFTNAIEKSYQESLKEDHETKHVKYKEVNYPDL